MESNASVTKTARPKIPISTQVEVLFRDGWLCSLCQRPTVFPLTLKYAGLFVAEKGYELPIVYYDFRYRRDAAPLLDHLACVIDHVHAHSNGGPSDIANLAVACNKCNLRKSSAEKGAYLRENPLKRIKGRYGEPKYWDGLSSLFVVLVRDNPKRLTTSEQRWLQALEAHIDKTRRAQMTTGARG